MSAEQNKRYECQQAIIKAFDELHRMAEGGRWKVHENPERDSEEIISHALSLFNDLLKDTSEWQQARLDVIRDWTGVNTSDIPHDAEVAACALEAAALFKRKHRVDHAYWTELANGYRPGGDMVSVWLTDRANKIRKGMDMFEV